MSTPPRASLRDRITAAPDFGNLAKTGVSMAWMVSGRGLGLVWTAAMLAFLGLNDYGRYTIATALSVIIALTVDHPFNVRAVRVDEEAFVRERATRALVGVALGAASIGSYLLGGGYVVTFGLAFAGVEILLVSVMSRATRRGDPRRLTRATALRQAASVASGLAVLVGVPEATLEQVTLAYLMPMVVAACWAIPLVRGVKPAWPGPFRTAAMMSFENFANGVYLQGDVLLVGALAGDRSAGIYALASTIAWAPTAIGQFFGQTYHESLRNSRGHLAGGPSIRTTALLAFGAGALVLGVAGVMAAYSAERSLVDATAIMAVFTALRVVSWVRTVALFIQERDGTRALSSAVGAALKLGAIAVLVCWVFPTGWSAPAAALGAVIAESVVFVWLVRASRGVRADG
ncbi:lipopolysaccharide biosynthesis protein [Smaragdicoccus niigatensis]|uniref:lipopolysaccharide biosynthesis protein n=1 Tax=Smaragdicoccus niigatensis TaxID=359359 RepID=UPI0012DE83A0|nr:hypothetical protein [Smaragdicoccus niigatensis]